MFIQGNPVTLISKEIVLLEYMSKNTKSRKGKKH